MVNGEFLGTHVRENCNFIKGLHQTISTRKTSEYVALMQY